jgi:hypothetical protein
MSFEKRSFDITFVVQALFCDAGIAEYTHYVAVTWVWGTDI